MFTAALDFIHTRKWLVELLLVAAIAAGVWMFCRHLIDVGVQRERAVWMAKVDAANLEAARQRGLAEAAHQAQEREHNDLKIYVADHPLHGSLASLCHKPAGVPGPNPSDSGHAGSAAPAAGVQPVPDGDTGGEPDQLHMLQVAFARCDALSAQVREWQARGP